MEVISPVEVTDARLTNSSLAVSTEPEWAPDTLYTVDYTVQDTENHNLYQCLVEHTSESGKDPSTSPTDGTTGNALWLDLGSTNRWAMFDGKTRNKSEDTSDIVIALEMGVNINSLALLVIPYRLKW